VRFIVNVNRAIIFKFSKIEAPVAVAALSGRGIKKIKARWIALVQPGEPTIKLRADTPVR